jgi:CheY-like chemotaxis protein
MLNINLGALNYCFGFNCNQVDLYRYIHKIESKKSLIFLIDDNDIFLYLAQYRLKKKGYTVMAFNTGEQALKYIDFKPNILVTDFHLSGKNGYSKNGHEISILFKKKYPKLKTILISSDTKFEFISNLKISNRIIFKDKFVFENLIKTIRMFIRINPIEENKEQHLRWKRLFVILIILGLIVLLQLWALY